eukprot:9244523-Lingulodinium_polyedra.AAC.1
MQTPLPRLNRVPTTPTRFTYFKTTQRNTNAKMPQETNQDWQTTDNLSPTRLEQYKRHTTTILVQP